MEHGGSVEAKPMVGAILLRYWIPVVAYAGWIFYLSSQSRPSPMALWMLTYVGDKGLHSIEYGILGILCYRAFRHAACAQAAQSALMLAVVASTVYGVTDEIHQAFVPPRVPDGWDVLADSIGATVTASVWHWLPFSDRAPGRASIADSSE